jgi:hypothetical protein
MKNIYLIMQLFKKGREKDRAKTMYYQSQKANQVRKDFFHIFWNILTVGQ